MEFVYSNLPEFLCDYFTEHGIPVVPEAWRDGYGSLWLTGSLSVVREYVDGGRVIDVPFEIRLRIRGDSVRSRLDALEYFAELGEAVKACPRGEAYSLRILSGASKSAIFESGEEEYRGSFAIRFSTENVNFL